MKVLMFGMSSYPGGIESYIANTFLNENVSKSLKIDFVTYEDKLAYSDLIYQIGHNIIFLPHLKKKPFGYFINLVKLLHNNEYDCIYVNMLTTANILPVLVPYFKGIKNIVIHSHATSTIKGFIRKFLHSANKYFCNKVAKLRLACSADAAKWLYDEKIDTSPIVVVPNAIDAQRFIFSESSRNKIRKEYSLTETDIVIGSVGRFSPEKNNSFMLDILYEAIKENDKIKLLLVGDGPLYKDLQQKVSDLNLQENVIFAGTCHNTEEFYSAFDLFLFPSTFEGYGISALEAQASGLQCLCSDVLSGELDVTNTVKYLPLNLGAKKWFEEIKSCLKTKMNKEKMNQQIEDSEYSVKKQNQKILDLLSSINSVSTKCISKREIVMNKPTLQVLTVTMNQTDHSLLEKMNIDSDALVGNQSNVFEKEDFLFKGHNVSWYSWNERGVGLNRNNLLMRATADIILFSDDDVTYDEGYKDIILNAFDEHPEADIIVFNVIPIPESIDPALIKKWHRIRWYNSLRYGAVRIAARLNKLREKNINYSLLFGGGAKYSSGEDSLFLMDCIKSGLKVYGYPSKIGNVKFETSSWFSGYNEKYFMDKGVFFYFLSNKFSKLLCLQYCIRSAGLFKKVYNRRTVYRLMKKGIKSFKLGEY